MADTKLVRITLKDWKFVWGLHAKRKMDGEDENMSDTMHYLLEHSKRSIATKALEEKSTSLEHEEVN